MAKQQQKQTKPEPEGDLGEAERFLAALDPTAAKFTFQTFDDCTDRELKNKRLSGHHTGTFDDMVDWLKDANRKFAGVFVSVNPTDGCGRTKKNITAVRALMADLDGAPLDPVYDCALLPHIITETSLGNFHVFWLVEGVALDAFEDLQRAVAKRFDGDPAVATLERCTRLPGFFHCKDVENPFCVRIVDTNDGLPPYTADQVIAEFPPLKKAHKAGGSVNKDAIILPVGAPVEAADKFVEHCHLHENIPVLRHYRGAFYLWCGTHYRLHRDAALERDLYAFLRGCLVRRENDKIAAYKPNPPKVQHVVHALSRAKGLLLPDEWEAPFWLPAPGEKPEYKPAHDLIAVQNGVLNLRTRELTPHSPLFFAPNALTFDYDAHAPKPKQFYRFLDTLKLEPDTEDTLQEMFGYLLTYDTTQQKIFLIIGPRRAGKGTLVDLLEKLVGADNCTFQTLESMTGEFGCWPLIDKMICVFSDARLGSYGNIHRLVERLLAISGGDTQTINRKYGEFWTGKLDVRFLMTSNVTPRLPDASGTIASRFILLRFTETFYDREDLTLKDKLGAELPGILNWALEGLDALTARGHFLQPAASKKMIKEMEHLAAPVAAFVAEWCKVAADVSEGTKVLYDAYKAWAEENGQKALAKNMFGKELRDAVPTVETSGRGARRKYGGVALSEEGQDLLNELREEKVKERWR